MKQSWLIAAGLICALVCSAARAGEDKQNTKPDKPKPADTAKPATEDNKAFDVDAFLKKYDQNKDGFLQRNELPGMLRNRFEEMDTNKDGKLSAEELREHKDMLERWHNIVMHRQARLMGLAAYVSHVARSEHPVREMAQTLYDVLQQVDTNKDGTIDADEWQAMRDKITEWRVNAMLERQGADKDGKVSKANARGRLRRHFDAWDLNHDGFVDRDELRKVFAEGARAEHTVTTKEKHRVREKNEKNEPK